MYVCECENVYMSKRACKGLCLGECLCVRGVFVGEKRCYLSVSSVCVCVCVCVCAQAYVGGGGLATKPEGTTDLSYNSKDTLYLTYKNNLSRPSHCGVTLV